MSLPSAAELIRALAEERDFSRAVARFPGLDAEKAARLLRSGADAIPLALSESGRKAAGVEGRPVRQATMPFLTTGGKLRIYCDGASRGNPGPSGAGAVLLGEDGEVVERLGRFLGVRTNNIAEYSGCILGLERAKELGASEVDLFADSQLLIRQLQGIYKVKNEGLRPLHLEAQTLLRSFRRFALHHIPREENALADEMSNRAIDERM